MTRVFKASFAAIILVLSFAAPVAAGPFEDALAAYDKGDFATALRLWRPLADQGLAPAQSNLGSMYENGRGVAQNDAEALKWYRLAANQGYAIAQYNLGVIYGNRRGVPQDYVRAYMWFNLSAALGYQIAVKNRDIAARVMTPSQIAEAQKLAREWKPTTQPPR
jgi:uncharacterized protein